METCQRCCRGSRRASRWCRPLRVQFLTFANIVEWGNHNGWCKRRRSRWQLRWSWQHVSVIISSYMKIIISSYDDPCTIISPKSMMMMMILTGSLTTGISPAASSSQTRWASWGSPWWSRSWWPSCLSSCWSPWSSSSWSRFWWCWLYLLS